MKTWQVVLAAVSCGIFAGCGAEITEQEEGSIESIGEAELAVGEAGCATVTADDDISANYCSNEYSISPNGSYDHGTSCPGQYVVEFDGSVNWISGFSHGWGDTYPSTQATCEKAFVWVSAWKYKNNAWSFIETAPDTGEWVSGECVFHDPAIDLDTTADMYRLAVRAVQCPTSGLCFSPTVKKARAFAYGTPCE